MHIKFEDSDGEMETTSAAADSHQPPSLPQCHQSLVHRGDYILKLDMRHSDGMIAASTSSDVIKLYSASQGGGHAVHLTDLNGHGGRISDIAFTQEGSTILHSSSSDGYIRAFDITRTPSVSPTERFQLPNHQECLSFAVHDHLVVAGGQGEVIFFDRRSAVSPLSVLEDTHQEDVTSVLLHPTFHHVISASTDGLIAVHNIDPTSGGAAAVANDDDSFVAALNPGCSIEQCGFYGQKNEKLWIRTGNETLLLWDWHSATQEELGGGSFGGAEASADFEEARQSASSAASRGQVASLFEEVHYLVGCTYDSGLNQLSLIAGTTEGHVGLFPIRERGEAKPEILPPTVAFHGSHTDIVRSLCWDGPASRRRYVTGGEDGLICIWGIWGNGSGKAQLQPAVVSQMSLTHGSQHQHGTSFHSMGPPGSQPGSCAKKEGGYGGAVGPNRRDTNTKTQKFRAQNPY